MKILCKNKHWKINKEYDINKILYLLVDRPDRINSFNDFIWLYNKNNWGRKYDLPNYINNNKNLIEWWKNNELHRDNNKPAVILANSIKEYWTNGNFIKKRKIK